MNKSSKTFLAIGLAVVVVLFLLFGGVMNGPMMNGGMMGQGGGNGGFGLRPIPTLLTLGVGILIGWLIFAQKK